MRAACKWNNHDPRRTDAHALSQALRRVHIGPKKLKLDEETRWQIAGEAVEELRRPGGWKELDEEAPMPPLASGSGPYGGKRGNRTRPNRAAIAFEFARRSRARLWRGFPSLRRTC
jgi:hypothetical protein